MNKATEPELEEMSVSELVTKALTETNKAKQDLTYGIPIRWSLSQIIKVLKELQTRTG